MPAVGTTNVGVFGIIRIFVHFPCIIYEHSHTIQNEFAH